MPRSKFQVINYIYNSEYKKFWKDWLHTYIIDVKKDVPRFFELLYHQIIKLLMTENKVRIPFLGIIRIVVVPARKTGLFNDKPRFFYPKTKIDFLPDTEFKKFFEDHKLTTYDLQQLNKGKLDWHKKIRDKENGVL